MNDWMKGQTVGPYLSAWWKNNVLAGVDHHAILNRIMAESGVNGRFIFMILISAGLSTLGLLLPSSEVLIGAMLISPLMMPVMGLGFGIATFDFAEIRRSSIALAIGCSIGIILSAGVVSLSPVQAITNEIAIRTKPNLFDLLVAMLSALVGSYALIRGHGGAVVGVAMAIALMPPLTVVGYGIATWNGTIFWGALLLFTTNLVTIALTAAFIARLYGFGSQLSPAQTQLQAAIIIVGLLALAVPLGLALKQIAWETLAQRQIREAVIAPFGRDARISQVEISFDHQPVRVRAAVLTPRPVMNADDIVTKKLRQALNRDFDLHVDQINVGLASGATETAQITAAQNDARRSRASGADTLIQSLSLIAGVEPRAITVDNENRRATVTATLLPGASLETYRILEERVAAVAPGWQISLIPPVLPLPGRISIDEGKPDEEGEAALRTIIWAAQRLPLTVEVSGNAANADVIMTRLGEAGVKTSRGRTNGRIVTVEWIITAE